MSEREMIIGLNIKRLRDQMGMTQKQLAKATGLTDKAITEIETGKSNPRKSTLHLIATALGKSLIDLQLAPIASLSKDEQALIDLFRQGDDISRDAILTLAKNLARRTDSGAADSDAG